MRASICANAGVTTSSANESATSARTDFEDISRRSMKALFYSRARSSVPVRPGRDFDNQPRERIEIAQVEHLAWRVAVAAGPRQALIGRAPKREGRAVGAPLRQANLQRNAGGRGNATHARALAVG